MDVATLQLEILKKIIAVNDLELLLKIEAILERHELTPTTFNEPSSAYTENEKVYIFNEWQQARIDIALKQVEDGLVISDEDAEIKIQKWFKEQEKLYGQ